jgi:hypothetical protein
MVYSTSGLQGREPTFRDSSDYAQKIGEMQVTKAIQKLQPLIQKRFIGRFVTSVSRQIIKRRLKKDDAIQAEIYLTIAGLIQKDAIPTAIADAIRTMGPKSYQLAADLGRSITGWGLANVTQRARLMDTELGFDEKAARGFYQSLIEIEAVRPLTTFVWCLNPTCHHWEMTVSDRLLKIEKCPRCSDPVLSALVMVVDPELGVLKLDDRDLTTFLAEWTNLHSRMEIVNGSLTHSIQAFPNVYVKSKSGTQPREIDLFLYSPLTKKSCIVECKVHEDGHKILPGTWDSICTKDLAQLREIMNETGISRGALVTNLRLTNDHVETIQGSILPKIGLRKDTTMVLPFLDETSFLTDCEKLLKTLDPGASLL